MESRFAEVRAAEVRIVEVRPAESLPGEVRLDKVRNLKMFLAPLIPYGDPTLQFGEVFGIGHGGNDSKPEVKIILNRRNASRIPAKRGYQWHSQSVKTILASAAA